jgi:hypothetical protein
MRKVSNQSATVKPSDSRQKKPYQTPKVIAYGSVRELTKGGGVSTTEAASMKAGV